MLPEVTVELDWRGNRYQSIDRGLKALEKDIKADLEDMTPVVKRLLTEYMAGVVKSVADRVKTPYPGSTSRAGQFPGTLSSRSGKLLKSMNPSRIRTKGKLQNELAVSFALTGIAAVHEKGATITPKQAKYLTIPLPAALNKRGMPLRKSARGWKNTFILKSKKGNLLIMQKRAGGKLVPLYVLKKKVVIPKRLAFEEAFEAGKDFLADHIAKEVVREFFSA